MDGPKNKLRSLQKIHTLSGTVEQASIPYKLFMKLSCLEMERYRRGKEMKSASDRVEKIHARFKDIDREKVRILSELNELDSGRYFNASDSARESVPSGARGGFKLKY